MSMPTDNGKDYFIKDFYKRTVDILTSYKGEYDVAMMINSMVGLLVVPKERYFHSRAVPDSLVAESLLSQVRATYTKNPDISLTKILRHLRNAVSHGNMEIRAEQPNSVGEQMKIGVVIFEDLDGTSAQIPIALLRNFLISFATGVCKEIEEKGGSQ